MFQYVYDNGSIHISTNATLICAVPIENKPRYCVDTNSVSFTLLHEALNTFLHEMKLSGLAVEIKLSFNEPFCAGNPIYATLYNAFPLK